MGKTESRWLAMWQRLRAAGDPLPVLRNLETRYAEAQRAYHNLVHIEACLLEFDSVRADLRDPDAVEFALWFHDAIYDPKAADNEEQSAALAVEVAAYAGLPESFRETVHAFILASKRHVPSGHVDCPWLLDIDLSILGRPDAEFDQYEAGIRLEYSWVPADVFAVKRAEILEGFLKRESIYLTRVIRERYESSARKNLARSLAKLRGEA